MNNFIYFKLLCLALLFFASRFSYAQLITSEYGVDINTVQIFNSNMERRLSIPIKKLIGSDNFIVQVDATLKRVQTTKVVGKKVYRDTKQTRQRPTLDLYINDKFAPKVNNYNSLPGINSIKDTSGNSKIYDSLEQGNVYELQESYSLIDPGGKVRSNMLLPGIQQSKKPHLTNKQLEEYKEYQKAQALARIADLQQKTKQNHELVSTVVKVAKLNINVLLDEDVDFDKEELISNIVVKKTNMSFARGDNLEIIKTSFPNKNNNALHMPPQPKYSNTNAQNFYTKQPPPQISKQPYSSSQPIILKQPTPQDIEYINSSSNTKYQFSDNLSDMFTVSFFDIKNILIKYWWAGLLLALFIIFMSSRRAKKNEYEQNELLYDIAGSGGENVIINNRVPYISPQPQPTVINPPVSSVENNSNTKSNTRNNKVTDYNDFSDYKNKTSLQLAKVKASVYKDEMVNLILSYPDTFINKITEWINSNSKDDKIQLVRVFTLLGESIFCGVYKKIKQSDKRKLNDASLEYTKNTSSDDLQRHARELYKLFHSLVMAESDTKQKEKPFRFLEKMNEAHIKYLIDNESYKVKALVLSQLDSKKAANILQDYSERDRSLIAIEISNFRELPIATFRHVALRLSKQSNKIPSFKNVLVDGVQLLTGMLDELDVGSEKTILKSIKNYDPDLFLKIKQRYISFNDLVKLPNAVLKNLIHSVDRRTLATALSGADGDIVQRFLQVLSPTSASALKHTLNNVSITSNASIKKAKQTIARNARHLLSSGELSKNII
jgi:flagellar motor switch protein FliG